ncbi:unnamed protein product [Blepharisma stoltei]|uniref:Uncharacterized protein n=1 Tax=Blepharisma stoltei TaxID=1481888 RepID=A0AAU9J7X3_9CILI|nr:unnamed protein product [Blepharisma stoltei]
MEFRRRKSSINSLSMLGYLKLNRKLDRIMNSISPDSKKSEEISNLTGRNTIKMCANKILLRNAKKEKSEEFSPPHIRKNKRHSSMLEKKENCIETYINKVISEFELDKLQSYERVENKSINTFDKYLGPNGDKEEEILSKTIETLNNFM